MLVYEYEEKHEPPMPEISRTSLCWQKLKPQDLVPIFGKESTVGEVLNGDRQLADNSYQELADFFHISPSMF